ncbi:MAG: hypothetical protein IPN36_12655 [Bacteroidetes bacterium]|nr:hypothetical protein [Bacteroidota bacterium]
MPLIQTGAGVLSPASNSIYSVHFGGDIFNRQFLLTLLSLNSGAGFVTLNETQRNK